MGWLTPVAAQSNPPSLPAIIPIPVELTASGGTRFSLNATTRVILQHAPEDAAKAVAYLRGLVTPPSGFPLTSGTGDLSATNAILFNFDAAQFPAALSAMSSPEAYALSVNESRIVIHARAGEGAFRAVQTLRQLLPLEVEQRDRVTKPVAWTVPAVAITDEPRFAWRGMLLDVGRTFFSVAEVKRFIDLLALHKLNVLHWHLTEDQGWRIEIKKYPRLTEVGAWRAESPLRTDRTRGDSVRYGGFYTQDQIRDVVAYAGDRFITVMPEIDLPGHSAAAIAAYPELGNRDIPDYAPRVMTRWGVHPYTYGPHEETFAFIEDVLTEVMALFPSRFIHIGGDEAPIAQWKASPFAQAYIKQHELKDEHELQSHFIARVGKFLAAHQRQLVGWDEIQEGGTPPGAVVSLWRTRPAKGSKDAVDWQHLWAPLRAGHDIVLAPNSHFYFDYYQVDPATSAEPMAIGGLNTLDHVYGFEPPYDQLTEAERKHIVGIEGTLWSEYLWDFTKLQYMAFPRVTALAEVTWSPQGRRDFPQFQARWTELQRRLDAMGVPYRKPGAVPRPIIQ
jgi:hexosaminidase